MSKIDQKKLLKFFFQKAAESQMWRAIRIPEVGIRIQILECQENRSEKETIRIAKVGIRIPSPELVHNDYFSHFYPLTTASFFPQQI